MYTYFYFPERVHQIVGGGRCGAENGFLLWTLYTYTLIYLAHIVNLHFNCT